jgi:hypothetical protein
VTRKIGERRDPEADGRRLTSYIPQPERPIDKPFLMPIEDVFSISGRGTVVTGRVERGIVKVGEEVEIVGIKDTQKTTVTGVEMFRKLLDQGQAGDNIGALLRGTNRETSSAARFCASRVRSSRTPKFKAEAYILTKEEGGRHTPFFTNYRPQFYFRTTDVTGIVTLPEGTEMVMPGDNVTMDVKLIVPIAMEEKLRFAIREGGRTVGAGVVARSRPRTGAHPRSDSAADAHREVHGQPRPHIDKKSREQFEVRTTSGCSTSCSPTPQTVDALMKLDLAAGVTSRSSWPDGHLRGGPLEACP